MCRWWHVLRDSNLKPNKKDASQATIQCQASLQFPEIIILILERKECGEFDAETKKKRRSPFGGKKAHMCEQKCLLT